MCGIVTAFHYGENKEPVNEIVEEMMDDQISRGSEGFGAIFIDDKNKFKISRSTKQLKILVDSHFNPCRMIILHHRMPSSSSNKISQTHPMVVEHKSLKYGYLVIHNGIIRNAKELKDEHEKEGFEYKTDDQEDKDFNDSECLAIEMAKFIEKQTEKINAQGSCAFVALQYNKKTKTAIQVFYGRNNSNPLKLAKSRDFLYLNSEGKGEDIKINTLYSFNLKDFNIKKRDMKFNETEIEKEFFHKNYNDDYNFGREPASIEGFKVNNDMDMSDYEMSEMIEINKETIDKHIDELFLTLEDEEKIWGLDIEKEIRYLVATVVREIQFAYGISTEHFAGKKIEESEKQLLEEKEKKEEDPYKKIETEEKISNFSDALQISKFHSR